MMLLPQRLRRSVSAMIAAAAMLVGPTLTARGDDSHVDSGGVQVSIAPGHDSTWEMTATNTTGEDAEASIDLRTVEGTVFEGEHPATLSITARGTDLATSERAQDLASAHWDLGTVKAGQRITLTGEAALPGAAGDEYRDARGEVTWRFSFMADGASGSAGSADSGSRGSDSDGSSDASAEADAAADGGSSADGVRPDRPGGLPDTGVTGILGLALLGIIAVGVGLSLARRRRGGRA